MNRKDWGIADALAASVAFPDRAQFSSGLWGLGFYQSAAEYVLLTLQAPSGLTGTLYLDIDWTIEVVGGTVKWDVYVMAVTPDDAGNTLTTASYAAVNTTTVSTPASAGVMTRTTVTLTNADSMAAGDQVWLQVGRDGVNDTAPYRAVVYGFTFRDSA